MKEAGKKQAGPGDQLLHLVFGGELESIEGIRFVRLTSKDVVRHDLVTRIVDAYDARDRKIKG